MDKTRVNQLKTDCDWWFVNDKWYSNEQKQTLYLLLNDSHDQLQGHYNVTNYKTVVTQHNQREVELKPNEAEVNEDEAPSRQRYGQGRNTNNIMVSFKQQPSPHWLDRN